MTSPTELGQLKFASNIPLWEGTPHFHSVKEKYVLESGDLL